MCEEMFACIHQELVLQHHQQTTKGPKHVKNYHMLGTKRRKKYASFVHIDFFFQHLRICTDGTFVIEEDSKREPRNIDFWIFLFRSGFEFQQKAPSCSFFMYNWAYIDWLRKQGNEHMLSFFAENTFRARFSILKSIVKRMFQVNCSFNTILEHVPKLHQRIGSLFIVLKNNIVGLVLEDGQTGVKVAGDVLERYAIDNYQWEERVDVLDICADSSLRAITGTKQTRCGLLHGLFLWSSSLEHISQQQQHIINPEVIGLRAQHVVKVFRHRPSSFAHLKRQKTNTTCTKIDFDNYFMQSMGSSNRL